MPHAFASAVIPASAAATWRVVRDFNGLPSWHPAIEASRLETHGRAAERSRTDTQGRAAERSRTVDTDGPVDAVGAVRSLTLADGSEVREALVALDDTDRHYTYEILTSPFPVRGYVSTIRVTPLTTTDEAFVAWSVSFDCDEVDSERLARMFSDDVFATGLGGLNGFMADRHP